MNTELNKKRTDNAELKQKLANNQQEIDILNEILLAKEQESNELSKQCKNLLENKTQTLEWVKNLNNEIDELSDKLEEALHVIQSLKLKNNNREQEINKMALHADELVKKYTLLKERALNDKSNMLLSNKVFDSMVGSRLLYFRLETVYFKRISQSFRLIKDLSHFDKQFFKAAGRVVKIYQEKLNDKLRTALSLWYSNALKPSLILSVPTKISSTIKKDLRLFQEDLNYSEKAQKYQREKKLKISAQSRIKRVFSNYLLRDQKRVFSLWKDKTADYSNKLNSLRKIIANKTGAIIKYAFQLWKWNSISRTENIKFNILIQDEVNRQLVQSVFNTLRIYSRNKLYNRILREK